MGGLGVTLCVFGGCHAPCDRKSSCQKMSCTIHYMWCDVCDCYNVTWCHVKQNVWCDIIYMHSDVTGAHWGNQECSEVREPCSRTFRASLTVRVSWTYPPGLTYEASGPSTDRLKMCHFSVTSLPQLSHCSSVKSWGDDAYYKRVVSCRLVCI